MNDTPSVAIVVLDTLRKDAFDDAFGWLPGHRFENAWSPSHWTVPVHASLFAGRYASELGVHAKHQTLDCPEQTVAEHLQEAGYTTRAFSCNVNISSAFDFDRGFEAFEGSWRLRGVDANVFDWETFIAETSDDGPERYLRAVRECVTGDCETWPSLKRGLRIKLRDLGVDRHRDDGAQEALEYVRRTEFGDREFLFVNLMEAHTPYAPPPEYRTVETTRSLRELTTTNGLLSTLSGGPDVDTALLEQAYADSVTYLSDVYRQIFTELSDAFDVVVTLSDHGELFGEHGAWQHAFGVFPELTHVPLTVSGDGVPSDGLRSRGQVTSLLDVHATVLDLASVDAPSEGTTLFNESETPSGQDSSPTAFAEYHGVNPRNRTTVEADGLDPTPFDRELFGVATGGTYGYETLDGFERTDVTNGFGTFAAVDGADEDDGTDTPADVLEALVRDHQRTIERRAVEHTADLPDGVQRQLEDLGYA